MERPRLVEESRQAPNALADSKRSSSGDHAAPAGIAARNFLGCILLRHIERFTYVDLSGMRLGEWIAILATYWGD